MRIGYLVSRYPAVSHSFVEREVRALRGLGWEVDTMTIRRADAGELFSKADHEAYGSTWAVLPPRLGDLLRAHVRTLRRSPVRYARTLALALSLSPGGARRLLWQIFYFIEAVAVVERCRERDLRHVHVHFANVAAMVALLARRLAAPDAPRGWSFTMHGYTEFDDVPGFRLVEKVHEADFVACISHYAQLQLARLAAPEDRRKLHIVRCGVDLERLGVRSPRPRRAAPSPLRLLSLGRLVPVKGYDFLLPAVAELREENRDVTLTVLGEGPDRSRLERLVTKLSLADHVALPGAIGQDELPVWFEQADVFCLASLAEGLPVALMEALAMELPVVATRVTAVPELIEHERTGLLCDAGRSDQLAAAIRRLQDDPELGARLALEGRRRIEKQFDVDQSARVLGQLFTAAAA